MEVGKPVRVEDFDVMSPLIKAYELKPGHFYLLIVEGKNVNFDEAHKFLEKIREYHPDIHVFIKVIEKGKKIEVAEKKENETPTTSGL